MKLYLIFTLIFGSLFYWQTTQALETITKNQCRYSNIGVPAEVCREVLK